MPIYITSAKLNRSSCWVTSRMGFYTNSDSTDEKSTSTMNQFGSSGPPPAIFTRLEEKVILVIGPEKLFQRRRFSARFSSFRKIFQRLEQNSSRQGRQGADGQLCSHLTWRSFTTKGCWWDENCRRQTSQVRESTEENGNSSHRRIGELCSNNWKNLKIESRNGFLMLTQQILTFKICF